MARGSSQPPRRFPQIDRNALWTAAFAMLAVLCVFLIFYVSDTLLRILFLIVAVGAGMYCWLMILDRRGRPRATQPATPAQAAEKAETAPKKAEAAAEEPAAEKQTDAEETTPEKADAAAEEPAAPEKEPEADSAPVVFVSSKGDKYHRDRGCVGLRFADDVETVPEADVGKLGRKPCSKCFPKEG